MSIAQKCSIDGCLNKYNARGYCKSHYDRWRVFGEAGTRLKHSSIHPSTCRLDGCDLEYDQNDLCSIHSDRLRRDGITGSGKIYPHGIVNHPLYSTYNKMKERCYSVNCPAYKDYGGRGIDVCERWLRPYREGFWNFVGDMGDKPSKSHSIDRIDNDKGYSPENCQWSTPAEQGANKRIYRGSEYYGVREYPKSSRKFFVKYKNRHVGVYSSIEEAVSARLTIEACNE